MPMTASNSTWWASADSRAGRTGGKRIAAHWQHGKATEVADTSLGCVLTWEPLNSSVCLAKIACRHRTSCSAAAAAGAPGTDATARVMCMCCLAAWRSGVHRLLLPLLLGASWRWLCSAAAAPAGVHADEKGMKPRRTAAARPCCNKALRILMAVFKPQTCGAIPAQGQRQDRDIHTIPPHLTWFVPKLQMQAERLMQRGDSHTRLSCFD